MELWLKGSSSLRLPVLPPEYTVQSTQNNTVVNVVALGDVVLTGRRGLRSIAFSSFFPARYDASFCEFTNIKTPKTYVELIENMKRAGAVKLIITGTSINFRCTIESFEWGENDGTGDIDYALTLQEYRAPSSASSSVTKISESSTTTTEATGETRVEQAASGGTYTVKSGDTLSSIARKTTGSSSWSALYEQNKDTIGSNPNLIYPGMVLTLPAGASASGSGSGSGSGKTKTKRWLASAREQIANRDRAKKVKKAT